MATSTGFSVRAPGKLYKNPTNLTDTFGTELGLVLGFWVEPQTRYGIVRYEEYGSEPGEVLHMGNGWAGGTQLRGYDADALGTMFPNTSSTTVTWPGANRAGDKLSGRSAVILYKPNNATKYPAVLMYNAVPMVEETARLRFRIVFEGTIPVMWRALRDSALTNDEAISIGLLANLSLSP